MASDCGRVITVLPDGLNLVRDDSFREIGSGFTRTSGGVICCFGTEGEGGAAQLIEVGQTHPGLIIVSCESRAENANGLMPYKYSLQLEVTFTDGTTNFAEWVPFNDGWLHYYEYVAFTPGTHGWERRSLSLKFPKAVKSIDARLYFSSHSGTAYFRNLSVIDVSGNNIPSFDTLPVKITSAKPEGFMLRDVAASSQFMHFENGEAAEIELDCEIVHSHNGTSRYTVLLHDKTGRDRAVTLYYTIPLEGDSFDFFPDAVTRITADSPEDYFDVVQWDSGANGLMSKSPFAAVVAGNEGRAIGYDPDYPVFGRVGFNRASKELYIAFDIAFAKESPRTEIKFVSFSFAPRWGFRSALEKYYSLFPEAYACRIPDQGLWMPFQKISKVEGYEDFGFKFKEGDDEPEWDSTHGIYTFRYTEPMTWWMRMTDSPPSSYADILNYYKALLGEPDSPQHKGAKILESSGMTGKDGKLVGLVMNRPWCNGGVWSVNSMPGIEGDFTDFKSKWNADYFGKHYSKDAAEPYSGEYIDSTEGYVTAEMDFRRDHFPAAKTLCYSKDDCVTGIFKGNVVYEYMKHMSDALHSVGRFMMGNGTPCAMWFLPVTLDVAGTETDWNPGNKWTPMSIEELCYRRCACAAKPYCFLMNTRFEDFTSEMIEKYMLRSLAFGMFPGFFSADAATGHYFSSPKVYNRDRALFKKYVPIVKLVAEAGWRPVTGAQTGSKLHLERFGERYLTIFNPEAEKVSGSIYFDSMLKGRAADLVSGRHVDIADGTCFIDVEPEMTLVLDMVNVI